MSLEEERLEYIKFQDALLNIRAVLKTTEGQKAFKYLFESLGVNELPELGITGELLHDRLGLTRAANAVFALTSQADYDTAGRLLAEIEKEKYERREQSKRESDDS